MAFCHAVRNLWTAWGIVSSLAIVSAQTTTPSNSSLPVDPSLPQLVLMSKQASMQSNYNVDPLTPVAGLQNTVSQLGSIHITGPLVLTTPSSVNSLQSGALAYVSCDPSSYPGFSGSQQIIAAAAAKINTNGQHGAIILYSTTSTFCTFIASNNFGYQWVYTTTNPNASKTLQDGISTQGPPGAFTSISLDQASLNNNATSQDALGPSPTTAVAMIILYSITGIITALFLVIIVTGAIRAHRHPERYGPRSVVGRPRQSRAKGIARAMLETLPIVKFGERDEDTNKTGTDRLDVELGQTRGHTTASTTEAHETEVPSTNGESREAAQSEATEEVVTTTAEGIAPSVEPPEGTLGNNAENGLACSVCTDDFIKGQDIRVLPCNHKFHPECIDPWLLNVSGTCPLCRVDLRPTTSHGHEDEEGHSDMHDTNLTPGIERDEFINQRVEHGAGSFPSESTTSANQSSRRRSNGLALYIQHTLNIRRMRDATPEERIAALRRLRTANRANASDSEGSSAAGERARNRMSARLSRLFHSTHEGTGENTIPEQPEPEPTRDHVE